MLRLTPKKFDIAIGVFGVLLLAISIGFPLYQAREVQDHLDGQVRIVCDSVKANQKIIRDIVDTPPQVDLGKIDTSALHDRELAGIIEALKTAAKGPSPYAPIVARKIPCVGTR